ncbi:MAG: hypothetical protein K8F52_18460 [Candidatus Scalindua rubra]|uniref:Uncharacterized protein n=1 Tax=Candidatus Scalindua brodae TaxID=237368 RepID=A0A0B0ECS2_9BACT|nr:MAG: hypothetical protein SCABRO_03228 [Candidatus Scalindua brodae]MBZ0110640.1 hypothetical protein [Candidatus Scalindua rubra]
MNLILIRKREGVLKFLTNGLNIVRLYDQKSRETGNTKETKMGESFYAYSTIPYFFYKNTLDEPTNICLQFGLFNKASGVFD